MLTLGIHDYIMSVLKRVFRPYAVDAWYLNLFIKIPQLIMGGILAFHFGPFSFGMPWSPKNLNLQLFEVAPWFIEIIKNFYEPFNYFPYAFGLFSGIVKCIGGICVMIGLGSRFFAGCIIVLMTVFLINQHAATFNFTFPLFFISVGFFTLFFGSSKYSIDQLLCNKFNWEFKTNSSEL